MIAKAATISHGQNAITYSVNKDRAELVKVNHLPDNISPEAMYRRMMLHQQKFAAQLQRRRPLKETVIRIEVSPAEEESRNWTMDDWLRLANEFIQTFDSIDLSKKTKRASSKCTNLNGSQYVVALHHDSKSGILHLHIDANRVDMECHVNDGHLIGERAARAANIINERRGWIQSENISEHHKKEISDCCMEILRSMEVFSWQRYKIELIKRGYGVHLQEKDEGGIHGYSVKRGNSIYKSSVLGIGRNLTPSKIENTWRKLHPEESKSYPSKPNSEQLRSATPAPAERHEDTLQLVVKHYDIATDNYHSYHVDIPEASDNIIREECSLEEAHPLAKIEEIQHTALLLFAGYLEAATSMAASSGGGSSDTTGWGRDKDDDDIKWAHRCAKMANAICRRRKGIHR
ncbi:relaxase/mobilization nuclease domain-containing protein [Marseilla massiliensis]|uniref:relaxase/mobilization nuclease domain-containing protein n=1 Tax=Marseilla massiliensis TaxID=1841864 RepID=UPI002011577A|nr:relaxase/mobilization nuclease domain-containing protein [Marseilla massiliensis]MCL1611797.1 relaxase/mobilization nuclease domain-containing protein [Marseilla massiliensis]